MRQIFVIAIILLSITLIAPAALIAQNLKIVSISRNVYESEQVGEALDVGDVDRFIFQADGGFSGNISLKSAKTGHAMKYVLHFKAGSLEEAQRFADYIVLEQHKSGNDLHIAARASREAPWRGTDQSARIDLEVSLPESLVVELNAVYFDINITGPFKTARIINEFGRVRVSNVSDGLSVVTDNSYVRVSDIQGEIDVSTSNNKIHAENIDTRDKSARFRNEFGLIEVSRFTGVLECETSNGPLDVRGVSLTEGRSRLSTTYSAIDAELISLKGATLHIEDNFSNVSVILPEDTEVRFDINVDRGGRIYLSGIPVIPIELDRERLIARTDNPDSKISVELEGIGTVNVRGKRFFTTP